MSVSLDWARTSGRVLQQHHRRPPLRGQVVAAAAGPARGGTVAASLSRAGRRRGTITNSADRAYLRYQYSDSEKLRIRAETHRLYSERHDGLREAILAHLALQPGLLVLDVGCGPGGYHASLQRGGAIVMAVDASPGMVREARARGASSTYHRVQLAQADAQALPFLGETFDRVLAAHMLYHVPDREAALRDMRRVLRRRGRVVLATNGTPYLAGLERLHQQAAAALGYGAVKILLPGFCPFRSSVLVT